jgi:hypothetical protein
MTYFDFFNPRLIQNLALPKFKLNTVHLRRTHLVYFFIAINATEVGKISMLIIFFKMQIKLRFVKLSFRLQRGMPQQISKCPSKRVLNFSVSFY